MAKRKELKLIAYLSLNGPNGDYKPIDEYTAEEQDLFATRAMEAVGKRLNEIYNNNPEIWFEEERKREEIAKAKAEAETENALDNAKQP